MYTYSVQAMHEPPMEHLLLKPLDNDGNNIAHLAAQEGIVSVFKVKLRTGLSESFIWILSIIQATIPRIYPIPNFNILREKNSNGKTPLQLAIETGNVA